MSVPGRERFFERCQHGLDLLIIGGGISGAGLLWLAALNGWRAALIEQSDFAYGSSSRSSKLIHGGLRYLQHGHWRLTRQAVRERENLRALFPSIESLRFHLPFRKRAPISHSLGLWLYDVFAGRKSRDTFKTIAEIFPQIGDLRNFSSLSYLDAASDDAELVMEVLKRAEACGGLAQNYVAATELLFQHDKVTGVNVRDELNGESTEIRAKHVVEATGAWQGLHPALSETLRLKPLRGSHWVLPFHLFPCPQAMAVKHPDDGRYVYATPWQGCTLFGTTDVEHTEAMTTEPRISNQESAYLQRALQYHFPYREWRSSNCVSTMAGVRPTVDDGASNADNISRELVIRHQPGYSQLKGGKLTTFLASAERLLGEIATDIGKKRNIQRPVMDRTTVRPNAQRNLGRIAVSSSDYQVRHLDDFMLRRSRLGNTLRHGGLKELEALRPLLQQRWQWSDQRWQQELQDYLQTWQRSYAPITS